MEMVDYYSVNEKYANEVFNEYGNTILRLAFTYLKNIHDSEDCVQIVFMKMLKEPRCFEDENHERAWVIRVTINTCKDILKSNWKRRVFTSDNIIIPIENSENKEIVEFVLGLPIKYRTVIQLYYFENYNTLEIAKILNLKQATIRTRLRRSRKLLENKMRGEFDYV